MRRSVVRFEKNSLGMAAKTARKANALIDPQHATATSFPAPAFFFLTEVFATGGSTAAAGVMGSLMLVVSTTGTSGGLGRSAFPASRSIWVGSVIVERFVE